MIKFFRRIRQRLLSENKFSKYLPYAVGEIVLVVIGILIALQINTWSEKRKTINASNQAILELQSEVRETKLLIDKKNKVNLEAAQIMKKYLENQYTNPSDSIKNRVVGYSFAYNPLQLSIPIIEREIGANNIIIGQKDLISDLQKFKDLLIVVEQHRFYLDNFWDQNVITFLKSKGLMLSFVSQTGKIQTEIGGLETLYDSNEFKDIIAMEFFYVDTYAQKIQALKDQLEMLEKKITLLVKSKSYD